MSGSSQDKNRRVELRDGFTIGDVRVEPLKLEMSGERGASVSVSQRAMDVLLVVADLQPRSVALEEIESRLQLGEQ
jgi:hypothetical protein